MPPDTHRGHPIRFDPISEQWHFVDDDTLVSKHWKERPCGHCSLANTPEGHDGCLGTIPEAVNACCGHGIEAEAYVQYENGRCIRGRACQENSEDATHDDEGCSREVFWDGGCSHDYCPCKCHPLTTNR